MTRKLTLTAKRQATLPAALCRELDVGPGDTLTLERRELEPGRRLVWTAELLR